MLEMAIRADRGAFALDVDATCPAGCTVVFGPSGAGKTSLARSIAGLEPATGRILLNGKPLLDSQIGVNLPPAARQIGYVFQEPRLFPHLAVRANLLYGAPKGRDPAWVVDLR